MSMGRKTTQKTKSRKRGPVRSKKVVYDGITFASGYIAGVACAIVSHPADTVVSKMAKDSSKSAGDILSELGFGGIWGGLGTRIIMIGTLTGLQWWIYDSFKTVVGLGVGGPGLPK